MPAFKQSLITPDELTKAKLRVEHERRRVDDLDVEGLQAELHRSVEGEVRFDPGSKAMYAVDASNYRQVPIGVVVPRSKEDVVQTVRACRSFGAPVLSRGGGTSLAGQCLQYRYRTGLVKVHAWCPRSKSRCPLGKGTARNHVR